MTGEPDPSPSETPPPAGTDDALFEALRRADRSESLGKLAAGIGRELNELLAVILGAVSTARDGEDAVLDDAEEACVAARELARRLLAMGRGDDGARAEADPRDLLIEAAKAAGAGSAVEIVVDAPEGLPAVRVERAAVLQALGNLVLNAIEAQPPPPHRPRVELRAAEADVAEGRIEGLPAGAYVEFEVRDNGSGIPPERLPRVWEPYFTTKKHAAGLGLPTALAVVRRHGGQIGADSAPGEGSVFTLFLPRVAADAALEGRRAPSGRFRTGRVLVMDDDPKIAAVTGALLESLDYTFDLARHGDEALEAYRRYLDVGRPYDAVILDLDVVGGMGGEEAFEELRRLDPDVRAIASHPGDEERSRRCLERGFCGTLAKPYRAADLGRVLGTVLG